MSGLGIPRQILDDIVRRATALKPYECCGFLAAKDDVVVAHYPITNAVAKDAHAMEVFEEMDVQRFRRLSRDRVAEVAYVMDPKEMLAAFTDMRHRGIELAVIYHSHPRSPAHPSPTDATLAYYPDCLYLIVSLEDEATPDIRSYWIRDRQITQASYDVID